MRGFYTIWQKERHWRVLSLMLVLPLLVSVFSTTTLYAEGTEITKDTFLATESEQNIAQFVVQKLGYASTALTLDKTVELMEAGLSTSGYASWSEFVEATYTDSDKSIKFSADDMQNINSKTREYLQANAGYKYFRGSTESIEYSYNKFITKYGAYSQWEADIKTAMENDVFVIKIAGSSGNSLSASYHYESISDVPYIVHGSDRFLYYDNNLVEMSADRPQGWVCGAYVALRTHTWGASGYIDDGNFVSLDTGNTYYECGPQYYRFKNTTRVFDSVSAVEAFRNGTNTLNFYQVNRPELNATANTIPAELLETNWSMQMSSTISKIEAIEESSATDKVDKIQAAMNSATDYANLVASVCSDSNSNLVLVTSEVPEEYSIVVPKLVTMGEESTKEITIGVKGRLAPKRLLSIVVPGTITLTEVNSYATEDVDVSISKSVFKTSEVDPDNTSYVTLTLTNTERLPGSWQGNFVVNVGLSYE